MRTFSDLDFLSDGPPCVHLHLDLRLSESHFPRVVMFKCLEFDSYFVASSVALTQVSKESSFPKTIYCPMKQIFPKY